METENEEECQLPPSKRFKKYENKGEEELRQCSLNIIDKHLATEEKELSTNLETIDDRILTLQQLLHSVKYHASLNLYACDKVHRKCDEIYNRKNSLNHPTIRRYIGKSDASVSSFPNEEKISIKPQKHDNDNNTHNNTVELDIVNSLNTPYKEDKVPIVIDKADKNRQVVPGQEPIIIGQRRREPFQKKVRICLGNTYRYIKDSEKPNPIKFQWRITIRTQDKESSLEDFISAVQYTLHESYAPHNIVIVKKPPFSLTHKGWGEFQVNVQLHFVDGRNKPINMIHTLKLARTDDSLSYTGLWRLGNENLYEIWIFDKAKDLEIEATNKKTDQNHKHEINEDFRKEKLESLGIYSQISYKDNQGNLTWCHTPKRSGSPCEDYSTECIGKGEWVDIYDKYSLFSEKITDIEYPDDQEITIPFVDNFYNKESNFGSLDKSILLKSINSTKEKKPDLILDTLEAGKVLSDTLSESSGYLAVENMKINGNNNQTVAVDANTISVPDVSCSRKPINIEKNQSSGSFISVSNIDSIKSTPSKELINIKPSLHSKKFSLSLPRGITKVSSVNLPPIALKTLFAGSARVKLKTVSLSKVKYLQKDFNTLCSNSDSKSINSISILSTNKNEENGKISPDSINLSKNTSLSNELSHENFNAPTSSSLPSTSHNQIILSYSKKNPAKQTKQQLISTLPQSFKIYNITTKKFMAATALDQAPNSSSRDEVNYVRNLEDKKLEIRGLCVKCSSVEEVLPIYWKNLQSFLTLSRNFGPYSADSHTFSTRCCERSVEFWLAREISKELKILNIKDRHRWRTADIVSWARKHLFCQKTDITYLFELEKKLLSKDTIDIISTLNIAPSCIDNEDYEDGDLSYEIDVDRSSHKINVVDSNENENNQKVAVSHEDGEIVMFTPDYMVEPIQFIDSVLSRIRNRFRPEEVIEGVKMDISKYILYKATLSLMEDLLRRSFSVAAAEAYYKRGTKEPSENELVTINENHIFTVLSKHRTSFQAFTQYGLGKRFVGPSADHNFPKSSSSSSI